MQRRNCSVMHLIGGEGARQQAIEARLDKLQAVPRPRQEEGRREAVPLVTDAHMLHRSIGTLHLEPRRTAMSDSFP